MKSIHIENIDHYTNEELLGIADELNRIVKKRKENIREEAFKKVDSALTKYFNLMGATWVETSEGVELDLEELLFVLKEKIF